MPEETKQASLADCNAQLFASLLAKPEPAPEPQPKARKLKAADTEQDTDHA